MEKKQSLVAFEDTQVSIGFKNNEIEMDMEELARAIGVTTMVIKHQLLKNSELKEDEFSYLKKVEQIENGVMKRREKRFFTEQGIYEITLITRSDRAKKFRKFARELITKYRQNEFQLKSAISIKTNEKLDGMVTILKSRDKEIGEMFEFFMTAREQFEKIDEIKADVAILKEMADEGVATMGVLGEGIKEIKKEIKELKEGENAK